MLQELANELITTPHRIQSKLLSTQLRYNHNVLQIISYQLNLTECLLVKYGG